MLEGGGEDVNESENRVIYILAEDPNFPTLLFAVLNASDFIFVWYA